MQELPVTGDPFYCLRCRSRLNAAAFAGDDPGTVPTDQRTTLEWLEGSVSVCAYCLHVAIYVIDRGAVVLRPVRRDEWPAVWSSLEADVPELVDDIRGKQ